MMKNECEIVKDLIPSFVDGTISDVASEFVKTHISNCENCKKILENLEKNTLTEEDNTAINYLKKYHRKMKILEFVIFILVLFIIVTLVIANIRHIKNVKEEMNRQNIIQRNDTILSTTYEKTLKAINSSNFTFQIEEDDGKYIERFYYKDKKFKKIMMTSENGSETWTNYGIETEDGYRYIQFYSSYNKSHKGQLYRFYLNESLQDSILVQFHLLHSPAFYKLSEVDLLNLEIRDDTYEDKDCYVIKQYIPTIAWYETWIDKESMLIIREIQYWNRNDVTHNYAYSWSTGTVTDEDVLIKDTTKQDDVPYYNDTLELLIR